MLNLVRKIFTTKDRTPDSTRAISPRRAVIDTLEDRRMMAVSGGAIGINVNDGSTAFMNKSVPIMKSMGVTTVRLWYTSDMSSRYWGGVLQRAVDYSNKGFDVTLIVQPKDGNVYSPAAVKSWFGWASSNSALKNAVDRWQIGNEPDHKQYWKGSFSQYVNNLLKPASEALRANGEKVVSAGPSWDTRDVQEMIDAGLLKYVDYVGYHPYAKGVSLVKTRVQQINDVVAGRKPIVASEWNVRGFENGSTTQWAQAVKDAYGTIKNGFAYNYYFALKKVNTMAGPAGVLTSSGTPNGPFYNAFASFKGNTGSVSSPAPAPSTGSTPSSTKATINGLLWNDSDKDGTRDSKETVSGVRTVFIDSNRNGKLDSGEKKTQSDSQGRYSFSGLSAGTYNVSRVFPSGYKLSNASTPYITVTVKAGQTSTVNLGSRYV